MIKIRFDTNVCTYDQPLRYNSITTSIHVAWTIIEQHWTLYPNQIFIQKNP